jgi:hypothetical protein
MHTAGLHDLVDRGGERPDPGGRLAAAHDLGLVDVVGGEVGEGAAADVLAPGAHRPPGPGRQRQVDARAGLDTRLLVRAEHVLPVAERLPFPFPLVEVQDAAAFKGEVRVAGGDPRAVLPGLDRIAGEPAAHRGRRHRRDDAAGGCLAGELGAGPAGQRFPAGVGRLAGQGPDFRGHPGRELPGPARVLGRETTTIIYMVMPERNDFTLTKALKSSPTTATANKIHIPDIVSTGDSFTSATVAIRDDFGMQISSCAYGISGTC